MRPNSERLVVADRFTWLQEAENASAVLRSEGIPSLITNDSVLRGDWVLPHAAGGIELRVRASDADRADDVLETVSEGLDPEVVAAADPLPEPSVPPAECPRCGSDELQPTPKRAIAALLAVICAGLVILGNPERGALLGLCAASVAVVFFLVHDWRCRDCGLRWS